jgi:tetratricopeptide (TPR) repeat protein
MKFQNDKTKALKVFDQALKVMDNNNSIQKNTFHEFFLLHMYGNTLMDSGESEQAEKILERSALIQENLYIWSEKSVQLYLPIWHL